MLTLTQLATLRQQYLTLLQLEVDTFGVQPTEVRHLIGRLGEIHAALAVQGQMARQVNQHGFDVIDPQGRRVSVKTTAQTNGFVSISQSTQHKADDLMLLRYANGTLETVYHGTMDAAMQIARPYGKQMELEINKARKLQAEHSATAPAPRS